MLRRYILFIVLSFAVFWVYALLFPPRPPVKRPATEGPVKEGEAPAITGKEEPSPEKPPEGEKIEPAPPIQKPTVTQEQLQNEEQVWLQNDYCRMALTRYGAAVREVLLYSTRTNKEVVIQGEQPVEIPGAALPEEPVNRLRANPLVITSLNGEGLDLSTYPFELDEKTRTPRTAVYRLTLDRDLKATEPGPNAALAVTKSLELAESGYLLKMDLLFENLQPEKSFRVAAHQVKVGTVFPLDARAGYRDINFVVLGGARARKLSSNPKKTSSESFDFMYWASAGNKYFALILSPEQRRKKYKVVPEIGQTSGRSESATKGSSNAGSQYFSLGVGVEGFDLKPREKVLRRYSFYAGPKEYDRLKRLSRGPQFSEDPHLEKVMQFGWFGFVNIPLLKVLKGCYKVIPNYGVAIIFLTILIKLVLYPLDQKSYKSMKEMQKLQPLIAELKKKYKDDPRRAQMEQMKLFKEHKVNPFGGCLPMLLQMPVLIAMFQMLRSAVELRKAPFVLWVRDLSMPDAVVDFNVELPLLGHFTLNILPLILILTFILQTKISRVGSGASQQDPQQRMMGHMMTVFFGIIFYNMPSGLTLYFAISTILRSVQQYFVQKRS